MMAIIFIWVLNFAISILNAVGCGKTWMATKERGGLPHFMNWMGALMSASGFTWCYTIALAAIGSVITVTPDEGPPGPLVAPDTMQALLGLGYLVVIFPILGSGLAITLSSWRHLARSRSAGDAVIAGWNTYAQVSNTMQAISAVPDVLGSLSGFFGKGSGSSSSDDNKTVLVIVLVAIAVLGGIATTFGIIRMTAESTLMAEDAKAREVRRAAERLGATGGPRVPVATPVGVRRQG